MDWTRAEAPTLDDIETLAREAFASLPKDFRVRTGDVVFMVQDFPDDDVVEDMELETPFDILGLFQGPDLADREGAYSSPSATMVSGLSKPRHEPGHARLPLKCIRASPPCAARAR